MTATTLHASAKANRNILAAEPQITVWKTFTDIDAEDWQPSEVVASQAGPTGTRQDEVLDTGAADEILAAMGYRRTSDWKCSDAPNLSPSGQWAVSVDPT